MDKIDNVLTLYKELKEDIDKQKFLEAQQNTLIKLKEKIVQQEAEISHLKSLLISTSSLTPRIIVSPEEALIDEQIHLIQKRSIGQELNLEEVKKLDILLKNKGIFNKENKTLEASSKKLPTSSAELIDIIKQNGSK